MKVIAVAHAGRYVAGLGLASYGTLQFLRRAGRLDEGRTPAEPAW